MHVSSLLVPLDQVPRSMVFSFHDRKTTVWRRRKTVFDEIAFEPAIQHAMGRNARQASRCLFQVIIRFF